MYQPDLAHRAARCRQCGRKLIVGVRRGLTAAQLVEAIDSGAYAVALRERMPEDSSSGSATGAGAAVTLERPAQERERDAMENRTAASGFKKGAKGLRGSGQE